MIHINTHLLIIDILYKQYNECNESWCRYECSYILLPSDSWIINIV